MLPKVVLAENLMEADGTYTVTEAARLLRQIDGTMSRRRLFSLMRSEGLMEQRTKQATAKAIERGYLVNVATSYTDHEGRRIAREPYALVTLKGLAWMSERWCPQVRQLPLPAPVEVA